MNSHFSWELDGVMLAVLVILGIFQLLPIPAGCRNRLTVWVVLGFFLYLGLLIARLAYRVICEG